MFEYGSWPRPRRVAERRADAARAIRTAAAKGQAFEPVVIEGRKITRTFWGTAWCDNLERYRDFAYRLDRGRSYVRAGSVIDLRLAAGEIAAQVVGSASQPYRVAIAIERVGAKQWKAIQRDCAGSIGSLVDLLAGKLSEEVMARLCVERTGLFPTPDEIEFSCSCPDVASMCKHVAAVMYGIGARLDTTPELLFTLRKVSADELLAAAAHEMPAARPAPRSARILADDDMAALFGIDLAAVPAPAAPTPKPARAKTRVPKAKPAAARRRPR